ncbi:response regulator [Phormidium sp. LEGE 05292]|uniref:response regulator n=1 Tax=[Phormidium] sp. LEGE 05292 TaxID=767427 RepID=UPI001881EC9E|nr:response regulator [Phormidium sp. LEGE 05292]MBE9224196.1 response regulator [Phormidium sp. LEGE 05292]
MATVLIVEDESMIVKVFSKILTKAGGFMVRHTENVEEVIQIAQSGEADLIIMDVSLKNSWYEGQIINGLKITQMLKADSKAAKVPVILVTASCYAGEHENFLKISGADGYIAKPVVDYQDFLDQIRAMILNRG